MYTFDMKSAQDYATSIVKTLVDKGYIAYFAGGWVRDYLMGHPSSDIDIATDAPPKTILKLFPKTIQVGISFGVVIVSIDNHLFEVATFRKDLNYEGGRRPEKIELSTPLEDAQRRDFTINGMFYNPLTSEILDFVNGKEDLKKGIIRTIGSASERFVEDRLRMIRAIRFASRFQFAIQPETREAISENAKTLFPAVTLERVRQELEKMSEYPHFDSAIIDMHQLGLLPVIFPEMLDTPLKTIQERVRMYHRFPKKATLPLYLLELFPSTTPDALTNLSQYLKMSNKDRQLLLLAHTAKKMKESPHAFNIVDWTHFYADPRSEVILQTQAAHHENQQDADIFMNHHHAEQKKLEIHIERIRRKKPLVDAALLQTHGIKPGKAMGILLREAERIAIQENILDAETIINILKESPLWKF